MSRASVDDSRHLTEREIEALASRLGVAPGELLDRVDTSEIPALAHLASCVRCRALVVPDALSIARIVVALDEVRTGAQPFPQTAADDADLTRLTENGMRRLRGPRIRRVWPSLATLALAAGVGFVVVNRSGAPLIREASGDSTLVSRSSSARPSERASVDPGPTSSGANAPRGGGTPSSKSATRTPSPESDRSGRASSAAIRIDHAPSEEDVRDILRRYEVALSGLDTTDLDLATGVSPAKLRRLLGDPPGDLRFVLEPASVAATGTGRAAARVRVFGRSPDALAEREYVFSLRTAPDGSWQLDGVRPVAVEGGRK